MFPQHRCRESANPRNAGFCACGLKMKSFECQATGCDAETHKARGLCDKHYRRWLKHGDPETVLVGGNKKGAVFGPRPPAENVTINNIRGYSYARVWPGHRWFPYGEQRRSQYHRESMVHRLVMAEHLGRSLRDDETVHHLDGDRSNNALSNLQLLQGNHGSGSARICQDCGSHNIGTLEIGDRRARI